MVADCAAIPVIAAPRRRGYADLASNGIDGGKRHVLGTAWEASLGLEQLEQYGKSQACHAAFVAEQRAVGRTQRPAVVSVVAYLVKHCGGY